MLKECQDKVVLWSPSRPLIFALRWDIKSCQISVPKDYQKSSDYRKNVHPLSKRKILLLLCFVPSLFYSEQNHNYFKLPVYLMSV